jgi:flagellar motor component MotA
MNTPISASIPIPRRFRNLSFFLLAGLVFITGLSFLLPTGSRMAGLLLDRVSTIFPYPFTIQNLEWLFFFLALGELFTRYQTARRETAFLAEHYLPEDESVVLQSRDLGPIRRKVVGRFDAEHGFLPFLIDFCILQFQASRSVDQTVNVMNSQLELIAHRVDLRYAVIRYFVWVIPTIGFIGTVVGIAQTLGLMQQDIPDLKPLTATLSVAFDTTIVALVASSILVFLLNVIQAAEERSVNQAGNECLKNLINKLYSGGQ